MVVAASLAGLVTGGDFQRSPAVAVCGLPFWCVDTCLMKYEHFRVQHFERTKHMANEIHSGNHGITTRGVHILRPDKSIQSIMNFITFETVDAVLQFQDVQTRNTSNINSIFLAQLSN